MRAACTTPFERALALALTTPLGAGDSRWRLGGPEGPADTVYLGVFRRGALEAVGGFDAALARQYYGYGWWKRVMLRRHPASLRWRQLAPPLLLPLALAAMHLSWGTGFLLSSLAGWWPSRRHERSRGHRPPAPRQVPGAPGRAYRGPAE